LSDGYIYVLSGEFGGVCTLTVGWQVFADTPVVMAATRDEAYDRPAAPPAVRGDGSYLAPRDETAGGTWLGVTDTGLVAAITNRWLAADRDADRSRGRLVTDCLCEPDATTAVRTVEREVDARSYAGFTLVLADSTAAFVLAHDGALSVTRLDPGVHVIGNVGGVYNGRERFVVPSHRSERASTRADSTRRVAAAAVPEPGETATEWLDRTTGVLGDHTYGACQHGDAFGTRSLTQIRTGPEPAVGFADGPPCETPVESVAVPPRFATES